MQHSGILKFNVNILNKASALQTIWCSSKYDMFVSGTPLALRTSVNKKCIWLIVIPRILNYKWVLLIEASSVVLLRIMKRCSCVWYVLWYWCITVKVCTEQDWNLFLSHGILGLLCMRNITFWYSEYTVCE